MLVEPILTVGIVAGQEGAPAKDNTFLMQSKGFFVVIAHHSEGVLAFDASVPIFGQGKDKTMFNVCYSSTTIGHQNDAHSVLESLCKR
jgi:hypothetical protein